MAIASKHCLAWSGDTSHCDWFAATSDTAARKAGHGRPQRQTMQRPKHGQPRGGEGRPLPGRWWSGQTGVRRLAQERQENLAQAVEPVAHLRVLRAQRRDPSDDAPAFGE
jgi:hypothetical protein